MHLIIIIWLLHNLVEASFDLFRYLLPGDQLKPWELQDLICAVKGCEPLSLHLLTWSCTANENKNLVPHNLVEASFDLFRYLLLGDQLIPWELHPLVSSTSSMNLKLL